MNSKDTTFQWTQLFILTAVHFSVDMFAGSLAPVLLPIREKFNLSLTLGIALLTTHFISCNIIQVFTGHLRSDKQKPLFLMFGLILASAVCLPAMIPAVKGAFFIFMLFILISGSGVALMHPELLRAIHALDKLPSSIATSILISGGFFGFAAGGWASALLVSRFGLSGLYILLLPPIIGIILLKSTKIKLAVETNQDQNENNTPRNNGLNFWHLMGMAVPIATSSTILVALTPTYLGQVGFDLSFGGFTTMVFGIAAAIGAFLWACLAHKKNELIAAIIPLVIGTPLLIIYTILIDNRSAFWILSGVGFSAAAAFPLVVSMARHAKGPTLGQRMAWILGGAWGSASLILMALGPVADAFGVKIILNFIFVGYLVAALVGAGLLFNEIARKNRNNNEII